MVSREELLDDEEYQDLLEDIRQEVGKYAKLSSIEIPRPAVAAADPSLDPPGVGLVFLQYEDAKGAQRAKVALHGRKFGLNVLEASAYDLARYSSKDFS